MKSQTSDFTENKSLNGVILHSKEISAILRLPHNHIKKLREMG